jgi:uncharacterized hydantoinase/oxoprolinase family protein
MKTCLERFQLFVEHPDRNGDPNPAIHEQARVVIANTQETLNELHFIIRRVIPGPSKGKQKAIKILYIYMWHEKSLLSVLRRLQARREEINLIMTQWTR